MDRSAGSSSPGRELSQFRSLDIDVLDPAYAPGGPSTRELLALLQNLKCRIVAFDLVEVNPLLDPWGVTALTAARIVIELLGTLQVR